MIASNSECSKCPITPYPLIDIFVMGTVSDSCSTFNVEPGSTVLFLLAFFWGINLHIPERIHSETESEVPNSGMFENTISDAVSVGLRVTKNILWNGTSMDAFILISALTMT